MVAMHDDEWDDEAGDWRPDEWDRRAHAVIDYRDRIADGVDGEVPAVGSPAWAGADERTQLAAYARQERDIATAQGQAISDRMAAEAGRREARGEAEKAMAAEYARRRYGSSSLPPSLVERRGAEAEWRRTEPKPWDRIPAPRPPVDAKEGDHPDSTANVVHRAQAACRDAVTAREAAEQRVGWADTRDGDTSAARVRV